MSELPRHVRDQIDLDGVVVVDKPTGPTSHDVVACVRRALGGTKVGHLGTLDPLATGVLPLVVGRATRLAALFAGASKQYDAVIRLGLVTDTYDITGTAIGGAEAAAARARAAIPDLSHAAIIDAAAGFVGSYPQRPPPFSAKKIGGVRAYTLARQRRPVDVRPVPVSVETLTVLSVDGPRVRCRIVCSSGFYVRSLAHDLGDVLGCGGCLETLRRDRHGPFSLEDALPLAQCVEDVAAVAAHVLPLGSLLPWMPAVIANDRGARRAAHGNALGPADLAGPTAAPPPGAGQVRVLDGQGRLLAVADAGADGTLHPKIVLV